MKRAAEGYGDAGRRGGPKAGKLARFGPHAFKVLCPEQMVAKMMGNQGAAVHQIESRTGSHLQFSPRGEYYPDTRLRVLTVHAPDVGLVMDALASVVEQVVARADEEHATAKGRAAGEFLDSSGKLIIRCALSKAAAGAIIGSKGERVKALRDRTGAGVDIAREVIDSHQLCTLSGSREQLLSVLDELNATVQEDVDTPWFAEWAEQRGIVAVAVDGAGPRRPSRGLSAGGGGGGGGGPAPPPKGGRSEEHINCTIFVGHLAQATSTERLEAYFSRFGRVIDADVRIDPVTGRSKGFGFITFAEPSVAEACLHEHEHEIDDRRVDVKRYNEPGNSRDEDERGPPPPDRGLPPRDESWDRNGSGGARPSDRRENRGGFNAGASIDWFAGMVDSVAPDYLNLDYCICCSLPSAKCGALIGRGGEHVAEVQRITGAVVSVGKKDPHESLDAHRQVMITGQLLSVYSAHMLLMQHYNDEEAQFERVERRHGEDRERHRGGGVEASRDIEDLQRQLTELSQELTRVRSGGGGGARRRSPPGRPTRGR